jgi:hypothetical protein
MSDEKEKVVEGPKPKRSVTLRELATSFGVLQQLGQIEVKASTGRIVGKLLTRVEAELKLREDQRKKIVERYGEPVEKGSEDKQVLSPAQGGNKEKYDAFMVEIDEMDEAVIDLSDLPILKERDFRVGDKEATVTPAMFTVLDRLHMLEE